MAWWRRGRPGAEAHPGLEVGDTGRRKADPPLKLFDRSSGGLVVHVALGNAHIARPTEFTGQLLANQGHLGPAHRRVGEFVTTPGHQLALPVRRVADASIFQRKHA